MRIVALVVAALLCVALSPVALLAEEASVIGPPQSSGSSSQSSRSNAREIAALQEELDAARAAAAKDKATYDKQRAQWAKQKAVYDSRIEDLSGQLEELGSGSSSQEEQVATLTELNESMRADYASLYEKQLAQAATLEKLTTENKRLRKRVNSIRPPLPLDPLDWLVLVGGIIVGVVVGLFVGIRRGEERATGGPIPEHVSAWWGGEVSGKTETGG